MFRNDNNFSLYTELELIVSNDITRVITEDAEGISVFSSSEYLIILFLDVITVVST